MVNNLLAKARDEGSIPRLGRSPGGEHGNPLQYSSLENPMDRGAWRATVHSVTESDMIEKTRHTCTAHTRKGLGMEAEYNISLGRELN